MAQAMTFDSEMMSGAPGCFRPGRAVLAPNNSLGSDALPRNDMSPCDMTLDSENINRCARRSLYSRCSCGTGRCAVMASFCRHLWHQGSEM